MPPEVGVNVSSKSSAAVFVSGPSSTATFDAVISYAPGASSPLSAIAAPGGKLFETNVAGPLRTRDALQSSVPDAEPVRVYGVSTLTVNCAENVLLAPGAGNTESESSSSGEIVRVARPS